MPPTIQRFERNTRGRDLAVGDIHGHFARLQSTLDEVRFDERCDRLFSVGDLVDRGPDSQAALVWLEKPWFHAVRGNHEDYVARHLTVDVDNWVVNGGAWFQALEAGERERFAAAVTAMPLAIEVETAHGPVGIIHADCPVCHWHRLESLLQTRRGRSACMWLRRRIETGDTRGVAGIRAVVVGHTPVRAPVALGNVVHIDTAGWTEAGRFTLLDLATLAPQ